MCSVGSTLLSDPRNCSLVVSIADAESSRPSCSTDPPSATAAVAPTPSATPTAGFTLNAGTTNIMTFPRCGAGGRIRAEPEELEKVAVVLGCLGWRGLRGLGWQVVRNGGGRRLVRCARDRCGRRDRSGKGTDERREDEPAAR